MTSCVCMYVCMYVCTFGLHESLCCSLEIITTLLIGYTPIQNEKFKKKTWVPRLHTEGAHTAMN